MTSTVLASERKPPSWTEIMEAYRHAPKLKADDGEDPLIIAKVRHTMRPKERLLQWFARVGLGKPQIMQMSRDEISRVVAVVEENRKNEPLPPPEAFEVKRPPQHFLIDSFGE